MLIFYVVVFSETKELPRWPRAWAGDHHSVHPCHHDGGHRASDHRRDDARHNDRSYHRSAYSHRQEAYGHPRAWQEGNEGDVHRRDEGTWSAPCDTCHLAYHHGSDLGHPSVHHDDTLRVAIQSVKRVNWFVINHSQQHRRVQLEQPCRADPYCPGPSRRVRHHLWTSTRECWK